MVLWMLAGKGLLGGQGRRSSQRDEKGRRVQPPASNLFPWEKYKYT